MTKLITVFGATGNQGGSVVRAILVHAQLSTQWRIRGITRSPDKPDARAMVERGVEMVAVSYFYFFSFLGVFDGGVEMEGGEKGKSV